MFYYYFYAHDKNQHQGLLSVKLFNFSLSQTKLNQETGNEHLLDFVAHTHTNTNTHMQTLHLSAENKAV